MVLSQVGDVFMVVGTIYSRRFKAIYSVVYNDSSLIIVRFMSWIKQRAQCLHGEFRYS